MAKRVTWVKEYEDGLLPSARKKVVSRRRSLQDVARIRGRSKSAPLYTKRVYWRVYLDLTPLIRPRWTKHAAKDEGSETVVVDGVCRGIATHGKRCDNNRHGELAVTPTTERDAACFVGGRNGLIDGRMFAASGPTSHVRG